LAGDIGRQLTLRLIGQDDREVFAILRHLVETGDSRTG
jgi:hypothetical protein